MKHRAFFGDAEYDFALPAPMIEELQRTTGVGLGVLCTRMFSNQFSYADINETIRLALIGGGTSPERATDLVDTYAVNRPLAETYPLAVAILEARWFGPKQESTDAAT